MGLKLFASQATGFGQADEDSFVASLLASRIGRGNHRVSGVDQHRRDGLGSELDNHVSESAGDNRWQFASRPNAVLCQHIRG